MVGMYVVLNQNRSKPLRSSRYGSKLLTTKHKSIAGFDCLLAASGEVLFIVHSNTSIQTSFLRLFTVPSPSPAHPSIHHRRNCQIRSNQYFHRKFILIETRQYLPTYCSVASYGCCEFPVSFSLISDGGVQ